MTPAKRTPIGRTLPLGWDASGDSDARAGTSARTTPTGSASGGRPGVKGADGKGADRKGPDGKGADGKGADGEARSGATSPTDRTRRTGLVLAASLAAILTLVLILPRLLLGGPSPEELVREHLDALVAGDVATVREHLDTSKPASDAALRSDVLLAAGDRVTSYSIDSVDRSGTLATVTATLHTGATTEQAEYVTRSAAANSFSRARWTLDPVPTQVVAVSLPEQAEGMSINGIALSRDELAARTSGEGRQAVLLRLLPGVYELALPAREGPLEPAVQQLAVPVTGETEPARPVMGYNLDATGRSQLRDQIEEDLAQCAESTTVAPPLCPFNATDPRAPEDLGGTSGPGETWESVTGTWEVKPPSDYRLEPLIGDSWTVWSEPGQAVFTPAPGQGLEDTSPRAVPYFVEAVTTLQPGGELDTEIWEGGAGTMVISCDVSGGVTAEEAAETCEFAPSAEAGGTVIWSNGGSGGG